jgi:hypothetical protein
VFTLDRCQMASDAPNFYSDGVGFTISAFTVTMVFTVSQPDHADAVPVATIRTSLEHAKAMAIILRKQLKNYEDSNGAQIVLHPNVWKSLGISRHDDW